MQEDTAARSIRCSTAERERGGERGNEWVEKEGVRAREKEGERGGKRRREMEGGVAKEGIRAREMEGERGGVEKEGDGGGGGSEGGRWSQGDGRGERCKGKLTCKGTLTSLSSSSPSQLAFG